MKVFGLSIACLQDATSPTATGAMVPPIGLQQDLVRAAAFSGISVPQVPLSLRLHAIVKARSSIVQLEHLLLVIRKHFKVRLPSAKALMGKLPQVVDFTSILHRVLWGAYFRCLRRICPLS